MTEPAAERTAEHRVGPRPLAGPVLWAGIAWLAVAAFGLVATAMLVVSEIFAMIAFMVGVALIALPLYNLFELWHGRTVASAVRSGIYGFTLATLVLAMWTAGRGFEWIVAGVAALVAAPGVLSLFAARQIHVEERASQPVTTQAGSALSPAELVMIGLILAAVLFGAVLLLGPTFSAPFAP